ncbi:MAG: veratrol--corrinoid protein metyltransferase [Lachnospiraceae bacterium]|nr:veratrol--corrinoid protein metyltransferase [Lachnospiraceae bacterium]
MAKLTEKENYLMCLRGEQPEWIPHISMDPAIPGPSAGVSPSVIGRKFDAEGRMWDIWGVELITSKEAAGGRIPKTWDFLLDDITKWHDVIKAPSLEGVDWEMMAKKDLENAHIDYENQAVSYGASAGYFQNLMAFMGFTEGLCALSEEPEECEALFDYLCDFTCEVVKNSIDYYKPDIFGIGDDTAAWGNPFVSLEMMQKYFVPRYSRVTEFAKERNLPITLHNCGKCEIFMPDMIEKVGVTGWNPAQNCNDLAAIKKRFGNKVVLTGCINSSQTFEKPGITEDEIREILWDVANQYAPGGGFAFQVHFIIPDPNDQFVLWKKATVNRIMDEISHEFYQK